MSLLGSVAPALAKSHTTTDAKNDVVRYDDALGDSDSRGVLDPTRTAGDIVSLKTFHGPHRVKLTMTFQAMSRASENSPATHVFNIKTAGNRHYDLVIFATGGKTQPDRYFARRNGTEVKCRKLTSSMDYAAKQVKVSIPRACLGNPRWVRVGAGEGTFTGSFLDDNPITLFVDEAGRTGRTGDNSDSLPPLGPRVRRG
ncbi:hypothetical protein [Marmoricola endophyticus]|uniref:hypothetical protein n=1 Tax=Marmoricola endophyticus TaxID=2040280 RepID=UPI00166CFA63|nr:hypothetical protein [Marmoricola endophyticus]